MPKRRRHKVPLTRRRRLEAERSGQTVFYGKPLTVNAAVRERYTKALVRITDQMTDATEKAFRALTRDYSTDAMDASPTSQARILTNALASRFAAFFARIAPGLAATMTANVSRATKANLHSSLSEMSGGLSLKTSVVTGQVAEVTKATITANVALIKSIPKQYFEKIEGEVFRSIQQGQGLKDVITKIEEIGVSTKKRAEFIAQDQTSKATTALNVARMKALGVEEFEWLHSRGAKEPRPLHIHVLNGKIYSLSDPPIIDEKTGERGYPGQLIKCGCRMIPVIKFGAKKADEPAAA